MRYLMTFAYDGTNYYGYQKQLNKRTIQGEIESKLSILNSNNPVSIHSSGRTDAHVHAINQKAHFDLEKDIDLDKFLHSLNSIIEKDIYIKKIEKVDDDFHARYNVKEKEYIYKLNLGEYNPFEREYVYQYNNSLNIEEMKKAITFLIGIHDFRSFVKITEEKENYERNIYDASIILENNILTIKFRGNGFMRYMIRNMVGTLINVGENKIKSEDVKTILEKKNRIYAGITASPVGLYLKDVKY